MKKIFTCAVMTVLIVSGLQAQSDDTNKKFRAGLKVTGSPMWLKSNDPNTMKKGTTFGYGFGLSTEFRLSDVIYFATGVGGDFENYNVQYRYDPYNNYAVGYELNANNEFVKHTESADFNEWAATNPHLYTLTQRRYKITYVTIPIALKMLTKEISGFRYFGYFGGDFGFRTKVRADDQYFALGTYQNISSNSNLNITKDVIPVRVGMNIGLGAEYRLAGSTSAFLSINYFKSFTNMMYPDSKYMFTDLDVDASGRVTYIRHKQNLLANAIKINVGILF